MIRNYYTKKYLSALTTNNEPFPYMYPNMYDVYNAFSKAFNIPIGNFILTNGRENAFKTSLIALNIKEISLEDPGWDLTKIICEGFNVKYEKLKYEYINNQFEIIENPNYDFVYVTDTYNNLFYHKNKNFNDKKVIIDEAYSLNKLNNSNRILKDNEITIGSFSKFVNPGLRLGYILFSDIHKERFNFLREEYISSEAAEYILESAKINTYKPFCVNLLNNKNIVSIHHTYITLDKMPEHEIPYKEFKVSGKTFYRISHHPFIDSLL